METIEVDSAGLAFLAAGCKQHAATVFAAAESDNAQALTAVSRTPPSRCRRVGGRFAGLSEVRAFTGVYLTDAAQYWSGSASQWTDTYDDLNGDVLYPAGTDWTGAAADAAAVRVGTDRARVVSAADDLQAAAAAARLGAADLHTAKMSVLNTVDAAEAAAHRR